MLVQVEALSVQCKVFSALREVDSMQCEVACQAFEVDTAGCDINKLLDTCKTKYIYLYNKKNDKGWLLIANL